MYTRSEGFFKGYEDVRLFFQTWTQANARGTIIITHGQGEHSESYHRLIDAFKDDAWTFQAWDLRGHGRSDGRRGYAKEFDDYLRDMDFFVEKVLRDPDRKPGPVILLCHSMGGLIQLKRLIQHPMWLSKIAGQVCSAPLLQVALPVPAFKSTGAIFLNKLLPQVTLYNEVRNDMVTRDPDVLREMEQDPLRHDRISSGVFLGFLESFTYVESRAEEITLPTLFMLPEEDPVVSTPASEKFFADLGSPRKELVIYPGSKHEVFNDLDRQKAYRDLKKYLDTFLGAS